MLLSKKTIYVVLTFSALVLGCSSDSSDSHGTDISHTADTQLGEADTAGKTPEVITCSEEDSLKLYERRIEPLVSGEIPSSCNQCHLSGVELAQFAQSSPCGTMGCLLSLELVDLENPADSRILEQIAMAEPESQLITEAVLEAEYEGFLQWIEYHAQCHAEVCEGVDNACNAPATGSALPRDVLSPLGGCSEENLISAFEDKVYTHRGRCQSCHGVVSDHGDNPPFWMDINFDADDPASMTQSATYTMYNLIGLGALNTETPEQSKMLCRHLALAAGGCGPGDHIKFQNKADPAYGSFLEWVEAYSECFNNN